MENNPNAQTLSTTIIVENFFKLFAKLDVEQTVTDLGN
jgi:hypothetical protein